MVVVRARDVFKRYPGVGGVEAVKGVSLEAISGELVALTGPSGCGKSTLLHLMGGMDRPTAGEVWLQDEPLHNLSEERLTHLRRSRIGFVFQFFHLLPTMTVEENVELPLLLAGVRDGLAKARDLLERVGLSERLTAVPATLSGGEMQRAALARALIHNPPLVLADEPTGNLDSDNGATVLRLLRNLAKERGVTVIMATHSAEAAALADRKLEMRDGRLSVSCPS